MSQPASTEWPGGWPPSNYPILFAILLLLGTAVALVVSTERTANELATYAYYLLVLGVAIRLVEHAAEDRLRAALTWTGTSLQRLVERSREEWGSVAPRLSDWTPRPRTAGRKGRGTRRKESLLSESNRREQVHDVAAYTLAATMIGGAVVIASQASEPFVVVSRDFLLGWFAVMGVLALVVVFAR